MGTQGPCLVLMQLSAHACNIELCYTALHSSVFLRFCPMSGLKLSCCENILQTSIVAVYNRRVLAIICSQIMQQITSYCYKNISSVQEHVANNQTETTRFLDRTVICGGHIVSPPPGAIPCNDLKPQVTEFRIM